MWTLRSSSSTEDREAPELADTVDTFGPRCPHQSLVGECREAPELADTVDTFGPRCPHQSLVGECREAPELADTGTGLLEVGRIGRPHGLDGEVTVTLVSNRPERLAVGSRLHTDTDILQVTAARPYQNRYLVTFAGVDDRARAEALRGVVLRGIPIDDPEELWVHELIGAVVVDQQGIDRGPVVGVVASPAGDLLELAGGALVPVRFVLSCVARRSVVVEVPDGLFEAGS